MRLRHTIPAILIGVAGILDMAPPSPAAISPGAASAFVPDFLKAASADPANPAPATSGQAVFSLKPHIGAIGENLHGTPQASSFFAAKPQRFAMLEWQYDASGYTVAPKSTAKYVFDSRTGQYRDVATGRFVSPRDLPWPKYPGFSGSSKPTTLQPGQTINRFGGLSGEFAETPGASASARGLPPGAERAPRLSRRQLAEGGSQRASRCLSAQLL